MDIISFSLSNIVYITAVMLFCCGLFIIITSDHYTKKIMGLGIFQSSVLLFFVALGKVAGGRVPIEQKCSVGIDCVNINPVLLYSSPLPHVLMLTAIVVGFATTAVALALAIRVKQEYNSLSAVNIRAVMER